MHNLECDLIVQIASVVSSWGKEKLASYSESAYGVLKGAFL